MHNILRKITSSPAYSFFRTLPFSRQLCQLVSGAAVPAEACVDVQGSRMFLHTRNNSVARSLFTRGIHEPTETRVFCDAAARSTAVIDIGANIGYYALMAARLGKKTYAFEPSGQSFSLLARSIAANNYSNLQAMNKAVSYKAGKEKFFFSSSDCAGNSLSGKNIDFTKGDSESEVETVTLDDFFGSRLKNEKVLVKIDVQGAEGSVIGGATRFLKENNVMLIMEFWPYGIKNIGRDDPKGILLKLKNEFGFHFKSIDEKKGTVNEIDVDGILKMCELEGGKSDANLLLERV